jgi:hypothetical protein
VSKAEKHSKVKSPLRCLALPTTRLRNMGLEDSPTVEPSRFILASCSVRPFIYLKAPHLSSLVWTLICCSRSPGTGMALPMRPFALILLHHTRDHYLTSASTDISPAFWKVKVTFTASPGFKGCVSPRSMMW